MVKLAPSANSTVPVPKVSASAEVWKVAAAVRSKFPLPSVAADLVVYVAAVSVLYRAPVNSISVVEVLPILVTPVPTPPASASPISLIVIFPEDVSESWALIVKAVSAVPAPISPVTVIAPAPDERVSVLAPSTVEPRVISPSPALVSMVAF